MTLIQALRVREAVRGDLQRHPAARSPLPPLRPRRCSGTVPDEAAARGQVRRRPRAAGDRRSTSSGRSATPSGRPRTSSKEPPSGSTARQDPRPRGRRLPRAAEHPRPAGAPVSPPSPSGVGRHPAWSRQLDAPPGGFLGQALQSRGGIPLVIPAGAPGPPVNSPDRRGARGTPPRWGWKPARCFVTVVALLPVQWEMAALFPVRPGGRDGSHGRRRSGDGR